MRDLLSSSSAGCSHRRSLGRCDRFSGGGRRPRTRGAAGASPIARPADQKAIAAPASALTRCSMLPAAFNDRKLMSGLPAANSPKMNTSPITSQQPAVGAGGVQPAPHSKADQQVHQVVERDELGPEQGLVGLSGEVTNAGDHEAEQPDQDVAGTDEQHERLTRVVGRGDRSSRHAHAPLCATDRYSATPTLPHAPCNRSPTPSPFVAGRLWPSRSFSALATVDLARAERSTTTFSVCS
jgi:hypothetical protein